MITKHYKKAVAGLFAYNASTTMTIKDVTGADKSVYAGNGAGGLFERAIGEAFKQPIGTANNLKAYGVYFGDGSEAATEDDYTLSGNLITKLGAIVSQSYNSDGDGFEATNVYTLTNNNEQPVTIREVVAVAALRSTSSSSSTFYFVADRTVLDTPVTIEPGGVGRVTYTARVEW